MTAIGNGDWLEATKTETFGGNQIVVGRIYYVCDVDPDPGASACEDCGDTGPVIVLSTDTDRTCGWCHCAFKPLKKPPEDALNRGVKRKEPT